MFALKCFKNMFYSYVVFAFIVKTDQILLMRSLFMLALQVLAIHQNL